MKLADYLSEHSIKRTDFAELIGVSQSYITQICQGQVWPGREIVTKIAAATGGKVTANDFVHAAEPVAPQAPGAAA